MARKKDKPKVKTRGADPRKYKMIDQPRGYDCDSPTGWRGQEWK